ncbi:BZ3500_MvSof-1268-A1-R1_Chr4-3g07290 [Microbotryum saponariae]|uniref:BZ3500_MvSof-1268-A1-R1_Chr4-3g07290 protein n=1 Tax=Microbotryum saponariae TaxID=289078 RepID=A0A2X0M4K1_9BASI|nr:BZ3500_MvSof-1268-A1-R1_Chr4-3g07290 [Microbotryum saponariae]SDA06953.1 BZ3501_MvSof-1269-A2-R1_Chr4-2g06999 [Microbotryum saponariae]
MQSTLCASITDSDGLGLGSPSNDFHMITRSSPSPWSKFLSPSLFTSSSTYGFPVTAPSAAAPVAAARAPHAARIAGPAPVVTVGASLVAPGFTQEREINPFEKSFATSDGPAKGRQMLRTGSPSPAPRRHNKRVDPASMAPHLKSADAAPRARSKLHETISAAPTGTALLAAAASTTKNTDSSATTRPALSVGLAARRMHRKAASESLAPASQLSSSAIDPIGAGSSGGRKRASFAPAPIASFTSSNSSSSRSGHASERTNSSTSNSAEDSPASSVPPSPVPDTETKPAAPRQESTVAASQNGEADVEQAYGTSALARLVSSTVDKGKFQHYQPAPLPISYGAPAQPSSTWRTDAPSQQEPPQLQSQPTVSIGVLITQHDISVVPTAFLAEEQHYYDSSFMGLDDSEGALGRFDSLHVSAPVSTLNPGAFIEFSFASEDGKTSSRGPLANSTSGATNEGPAPRKRGRKPKSAVPEEDAETVKVEALERNRVAASKSRRRKKERVSGLEQSEFQREFLEARKHRPRGCQADPCRPLFFATDAANLATSNVQLQQMCQVLSNELHGLRAMLKQLHPLDCDCVHVRGYCAREAAGGGIPTIERIAGRTLSLDYTKVPRWGSEDDCYCATPGMPNSRSKRGAPAADESHPDARRAIPLKRARV